jgi:hypothetical protein
MIRIWQSYSCNNSSSYRLVARFADAAIARATADELERVLPAHAAEVDARPDYDEAPSRTTLELGHKYGFEWPDLMYWASGHLTRDLPHVAVEGATLVVMHTYCDAGLGRGLEMYVEKRGAFSVHTDDTSMIEVTLLFRAAPGVIDGLDDELDAMFAQRNRRDFTVTRLRAPWVMHEKAYGALSYFRDAGTVGLHFPLDPRDLEHLKAWMRSRGIAQHVIRIGNKADLRELEAIRTARCASCSGALEYLHPALHDIETPQLVCRPCGGFYEVGTFV